mgnify:FL=1
MSKKRIVKNYDALSDEILTEIKLEYPFGFSEELITYPGPNGERISALYYELEDVIYLVRMTKKEAEDIIDDDDDYDEDGNLSEEFIEEYSEEEDED